MDYSDVSGCCTMIARRWFRPAVLRICLLLTVLAVVGPACAQGAAEAQPPVHTVDDFLADISTELLDAKAKEEFLASGKVERESRAPLPGSYYYFLYRFTSPDALVVSGLVVADDNAAATLIAARMHEGFTSAAEKNAAVKYKAIDGLSDWNPGSFFQTAHRAGADEDLVGNHFLVVRGNLVYGVTALGLGTYPDAASVKAFLSDRLDALARFEIPPAALAARAAQKEELARAKREASDARTLVNIAVAIYMMLAYGLGRLLAWVINRVAGRGLVPGHGFGIGAAIVVWLLWCALTASVLMKSGLLDDTSGLSPYEQGVREGEYIGGLLVPLLFASVGIWLIRRIGRAGKRPAQPAEDARTARKDDPVA